MNRALFVLLIACGGKRDDAPPASSPPRDAAVVAPAATSDAAAADDWPELADYPRVPVVRTISLPLAQPDHPRFDVGGPVIANELAIVSSSQLGFVAVDYQRGAVAWTKPAGLHVAPPLVHGTNVVLVGDCAFPPQIPDDEALLGCLRVVTTTGSDQAYLAIRGAPRAIAAFAGEKGPQQLWTVDERTIRWRRGEQAVTVDVVTGAARPTTADDPPIALTYRGKRWQIRHVDGRIVATGARPWETEHDYALVAGLVWLGDAPVLRVVNLGTSAGTPEVNVFDMDPTGSLRAAFARPAPGIGVLGHGLSSHGDLAIAVRADRSMTRDFVAGYAANAMLVYVHPLPTTKRLDPVGLAVADDAVVVFHDGDTLTILPELLAPPTAPGATKGVSQNPTP